MSSRLVTDRVWETITAACQKRKQKAWVAVAFFGKAGPSLLPLTEGSHLVVNVSDDSLKKGLTHPKSLLRMNAIGVHVYECTNLHAKVFVFGKTAIIGSANASASSSNRLSEAVLLTTSPQVVTDAREFVKSKALVELGPERLRELQKLYREPQHFGPRPKKRRTKGNSDSTNRMPTLRIAQLEREDPPEESNATAAHGRTAANAKAIHPDSHEVVEFHWYGQCPFQPGIEVIQVTTEPDGTAMVSPPGRVLHTELFKHGRRNVTFVYLEQPIRRRRNLDILAKQAGHGSKKVLKADGIVNDGKFQRILREVWRG